MSAEYLTHLRELTFSWLETPEDQIDVSLNIGRVVIWSGFSSGSIALASFIFNRFLAQESAWKAFAPSVLKASLTSFLTFVAIAVNALYRWVRVTNETEYESAAESFNKKVPLFAKGSTLIGLAGAAAAWAAKSAISNVQVNSLAKHAFSPLLGLGAVGSILWLFLHWQNNKLETSRQTDLS